MSAITATPPTPTPPVNLPPATPLKISNPLPESVNIKTDHGHDATSFFEKHQAEQRAAQAAAATPPTAPAAPAATSAPVAPSAPAKADEGSLISRMMPKSATPPAPAAPAKPEGELEVTLDPKASPAAHESFKLIKTRAEGLQSQLIIRDKEVAQLRAELDAAKKGVVGPDAEEITKLKAEHKSMSDRLMVVDLQDHPRFKAEFVDPQNAALAAAQEIAGPEAKLGGLLALPRSEFGKAVSELSKNLSDFDRVDFAENMRKAYAIKQQANSALAHSREIYSGLRAKTMQAQKQAFDAVVDPIWTQVSEHLIKTDVPADATPEVRASIERYNSELESIRANAEKIATGPTDERGIATSALKAAAYDFHINRAMPRLLGEVQVLMDQLAASKKELAELRSRAPGRQLSGSPNPTEGGPDLFKMSHSEAANFLASRGRGTV